MSMLVKGTGVNEEVMGRFGIHLEGQMMSEFGNRVEVALVNTHFQKKEEYDVT